MTTFHRKQEGKDMQIPWPLALWTVFEIVMNTWILITLFKVGIR